MDVLDELALILRPAGGGVHTVSTGRAAQLALQRRIYGVAVTGVAASNAVVTDAAAAVTDRNASEAIAIDARFRAALASVASARVAILAIPSDTGAGLVRGAAFGPSALREAVLARMPDFPARAARAGVVDVGDVLVVPQLLEDDMCSDGQLAATRAAIYPGIPPAIAATLPVAPLSIAHRAVELLLSLNPALKLFALGGDHSVAWPVVAGLAAARRAAGAPPFAIVHPDAHTDLLPERQGVKHCFATWAYHANDLIGRGGRLVQVGVRASRHPREYWEGTLGVRQFWAAEVAARGEAATIDDILAHLASIGVRDVYLSNDIDGTDAGAAPATGAPEPNGLSVGFVRALIQRLGNRTSLIGADLVEVAPSVGGSEGARATLEVGARYVLDSLAALSGDPALAS